MAKETVFRKSLFGGFDRKQVIEYIAYLTSHCPDTATREEILALRKHIEDLENLIAQRLDIIEELKAQTPDDNIDPVIVSLQEIVRNGRKLKKSNEKIDSITSTIQKDIDEKRPKIDSLLAKLTSISTEITSIQARLGSISVKLSEIDFENISSPGVTEESNGLPEVVIPVSAVNEQQPSVEEINHTESSVEDDLQDYPDDDTEYTPLDINYAETGDNELINSIDNFFTELEKIADAQLFDLTTLLDNQNPDNQDHQ